MIVWIVMQGTPTFGAEIVALHSTRAAALLHRADLVVARKHDLDIQYYVEAWEIEDAAA